MGVEMSAKCRKCGCKFSARSGGGFMFHLLHCDTCGRDKSISFEELGEAHLRYLKGLKGPYCVATSEHDRFVRENYPGDPLPEEDYHKVIDSIAGECRCGGHFRMDAKPRCPKCKSDDYIEDEDGMICHYD
jgi:hypothetical protein